MSVLPFRRRLPACPHCGELVRPGDQRTPLVRIPTHMECGARLVLGGLNHQRGTCSCCGGSDPPDPPELSRREAARQAWAHWRGLTLRERDEAMLRQISARGPTAPLRGACEASGPPRGPSAGPKP